MAAGAFIHQTGLRQLEDLKGIGLKMPIITICFTMAGISMIGFPPLNGFISKWYIVLGSMDVVKLGSYSMSVGVFAVFMLLLSSFMNLMYYGPIIYGAWFRRKKGEETVAVFPKVDPSRWMWVPLVVLALGTLIFGIFPHFPAHFAENFGLMAFH